MTPLVLLILAIMDGGNCMAPKLFLGYDESENFIEPTENVQETLKKTKEQISSLANLIFALQKFNSFQNKLQHKEKEMKTAMGVDSSTEEINKPTSPPEINGDNQDKDNDKDSTNNPTTISFAKEIPSLHLQSEEKKKFIHSIIDGWSF